MNFVSIVRKIAERKNATASQIALAWLLHNGDDFVPISGTKQRTYLEENLRAIDITLTLADLKEIDQSLPKGIASGPRYNEQKMKFVDR